jgi:hypothetical protein
VRTIWRARALAPALLLAFAAGCGGDVERKNPQGAGAQPVKPAEGEWAQRAETACADAATAIEDLRGSTIIANVDPVMPGLVESLRALADAAREAPDAAAGRAAAAAHQAGQRLAAAVDDRRLAGVARGARALRGALDDARTTLRPAGVRCKASMKAADVEGLTVPFYVQRVETIHNGLRRAVQKLVRHPYKTEAAFWDGVAGLSRTFARGLERVPPGAPPRAVRRVTRRYLAAVADYGRAAGSAAAAYRSSADLRTVDRYARGLNRLQRRFEDAYVDFSTHL